MTEDEAKKKWCPLVRTGLVAGMAVNRHVADAPGAVDGVYEETRCIAVRAAWLGAGPLGKRTKTAAVGSRMAVSVVLLIAISGPRNEPRHI